MKNAISLASLLLMASLIFPVACGSPQEDDKAKLTRLMRQRANLDAEIAALEASIGNNDSTNIRVKTVGIDQVKPQMFRHFVDLQGKIEAEDNVPVTSKMPGVLTKVHVKNGNYVKKGQLLATVDDGVMRRSMAELEQQLTTATDIYNRQKSLWDQKIGTEVQYIQAKNAKEGLEKSIETMKEQLGQTRIYAPISGTVDMVMLKTGQAIAPGVPLCNIVNLGDLKVVGQVPEAYAARVRKGDKVVIYLPDLEKELNSTINYVSKSINNTNRTFTVECRLPGSNDYRANMIAVLKIIDYEKSDALVVPVNVIQLSEDGEFILAAEKTGANSATVKKVSIEQGPNYNGFVEITKGLNADDWYIATGYQDVNDGESIAF